MREQTWLSKIMFFLNIVLTVLTFLAYSLPFLTPKAFPFLSVLTLILPLFLILNFFFFVYWLLQFKRYMLLSGLALLLGITFINRFYKFSETNLPKEDTDFKVMSYNVRLFNIYEWLPKDDVAEQISKLINEKSPDILCLQDFTDNEDADFTQFPYSYVKLNGEKLKYGQAIYSNWFEKCENENITLKIMQSHNNQDIFRATCDKDSLTFRVWYGTSEQNHTKGFFSKIEILEKSSETILEKVKGLIYGF